MPAQLSRALAILTTIAAVSVASTPAVPKRGPGVAGSVFASREPKLVGGESVLAPTPPKQDINVTVSLVVTFDPGTQIYTFTYTVENRNNSGNALDAFGVGPVPPPVQVAAPTHWKGFFGWEDRSDAVVWTVWDGGGVVVPSDTLQTVNITVGPYHPQPGTTVSGFVIKSRQPPLPAGSTLTWYAQGFDTLIAVGEEPEDGVIPSSETLWIQSVQGQIGGPDINSVVGVGSGEPKGDRAQLSRATPNPTQGGVAVSYYLPAPATVRLGIYDVGGRMIALLADGQRPAGLHSVSWNGLSDEGRRARAGVYFSKLVVDGRPVGQQKVTVLR